MELCGNIQVQLNDESRIEVLADMAGISFMEELMTKELLDVLSADREVKEQISKDIILKNLYAATPYKGTYCTEDNAALAIAYLKSDLGAARWEDIENGADTAAINDIEDEAMRNALLVQLDDMAPITNFGWQETFAPATEANPQGDFIHFVFLAVGQHKRGTGAFRRLLEPYLAYADAHHIPCFLESYSDRLEQLYGHFGFETVKTFTSPDFQIYERCMMRHPR